ncbi:hypothetical protein KSB_21930 [Ktedonobacter robiniae]|uniref:Uncharacterized protein n=1 Tax=Ktedonobacter robiniae TaxID=2778365 RepID=A0ABQ3UM12_9CHLR|nr:hypothetical protein KSB_21930 [Ktedonobacter robiniae]
MEKRKYITMPVKIRAFARIFTGIVPAEDYMQIRLKLSADALDFKALGDEFDLYLFQVIALNFDVPIFNRSAGAT